MQKGSKEGFLKILKGHRDLWEFALKIDGDNLNDFGNNSELPKDFFESFKGALEGEIKFRDFSGDFNKDQFETEWAQLRFKEAQ